jgi:vancomycin permeability regulator SanA
MNKLIYLVSVSLLMSSCMLFGSSIKKTCERSLAAAPYDATIVPGVTFEDSTWSNTMKMRVSWANHLYKIGATKNIIYSGSSVYTDYRESTIMALYGEELGVPSSAIFEDRRAQHSTENVYYGYLVAKKTRF